MALIKSDFLIEANTRIRLESSQRKKVKEFHGAKEWKFAKKAIFFIYGEKQQFLIFLYVDKFIFACCFPAAPFLSNFPFYLFSFYFLILFFSTCHQSG